MAFYEVDRNKIIDNIMDSLYNYKPLEIKYEAVTQKYNLLKDIYQELQTEYFESWDYLLNSFIKAMKSNTSGFLKHPGFILLRLYMDDLVDAILRNGIPERYWKIIRSIKIPKVITNLIYKYDIPSFEGKTVFEFEKTKSYSESSIYLQNIKILLEYFKYETVSKIIETLSSFKLLAIIIENNQPYIDVNHTPKTLTIWDPVTLKEIFEKDFDDNITTLTVINNQLILGFQTGFILNYTTGKEFQAYDKRIDHLFSLGHLLISVSSGSTIKIWDDDVNVDTIIYNNFDIRKFCLLPQGFVLATVQGKILVWNMSGSRKEYFILSNIEIYINSIDLLSPHEIIFLTYKNEIGTLDLLTGKQIILTTFKMKIDQLKLIRPDKAALLINNKIYIWDIETLVVEKELNIETSEIEVTKEGNLLSYSSNKIITLLK